MAKPLRPYVRGGGFYPSRKYTPLVYPGGYTTRDASIWPHDPLGTFSGAIARFHTIRSMPIKSLKVDIKPKQDLHGYDSPWPAGGGANKWNEDCEAGALNPATGQPTGTVGLRSKTFSDCLPETRYRVACPVLSTSYVRVFFYQSDETFISVSNWFANKATFETPALAAKFKIAIADSVYGTTYNYDIAINNPISVMTYSPFSNFCPITGWKGVEAWDTGKNLISYTPVWLNYSPKDVVLDKSRATFLKAGTQYVFSFDMQNATSWRIAAVVFDNDGNRLFNSSVYYLGLGLGPNSSGQYYVWWDNRSDKTAFMIPVQDCFVMLFFNIGDVSASTVMINPMLEVGNTASDYEPYNGDSVSATFGTLWKNKIPNDYNFESGTEKQGVTATINADGSIRLVSAGTGTSTAFFDLNKQASPNIVLPAGTYNISGTVSGKATVAVKNAATNVNLQTPFTLTEDTGIYVYLSCASNVAYDVTVYPQIEAGSSATVYEPYRDEVFGGSYNFIDGGLEDGMGETDLGSLAWEKFTTSGNNYWFRAPLILKDVPSSNDKPNMLCSAYATETPNNVYTGVQGISKIMGYDYIVVCDMTYADAASFKTAMSGVQLVYELAAPIETTITPTPITALKGYNAIWSDAGPVEVTAYGTQIVEPDVQPLQAMNLLLGGAYRNNHTPEDVSDEEALNIITGGADR